MNGDRSQSGWSERLAAAVGGDGDGAGASRLLRDAVAVVRERIGEIANSGVKPLLDEAAASIRPATREELLARFPGCDEDEVARHLIERSARSAGGVALGIGGILAAQAGVAVTSARPARSGTAIGAAGVTGFAEVIALFMVEAKLRADLDALAGRPPVPPRALVAAVLGEVDAVGGWRRVRRGSLQRMIPDATVRRTAARFAAMVPGRFARVVVPEVVAPLVGAAWSARLATRQVREAGERHWAEVGGTIRQGRSWTTVRRVRPELPAPGGRPDAHTNRIR